MGTHRFSLIYSVDWVRFIFTINGCWSLIIENNPILILNPCSPQAPMAIAIF